MTDANAAVEGAWAYENLHVNALFREWADPILDSAAVGAGDRVLDVACGTGIVARTALERVGDEGDVTGLDLGPGMLAVAESITPEVTWVEGEAGDLPFDDGEYDAVVSQFGLMFFPDKVAAISEMIRVAGDEGRVAVSVWESLERSEAYPTTVDILQRRAGTEAADALRAPFVLGDTDELRDLFQRAGADSVRIETRVGTARFPSVRAMVEADLRGWLPVMGVELEEQLILEVLAEAEDALSQFATDNGDMVFDAPGHIVTVP